MEAQESNHFEEIRQGFELILQGHLSYIKLERNTSQTSITYLANKVYPTQIVATNATYGAGGVGGAGIASKLVHAGSWTLSVTLSTSIAEVMRGNNFELYAELNIGNKYSPIELAQNQSIADAKWEMHVKYIINDIDEFISDLRQRAWEKYSIQINGQLDEVLDVEDRQ